MPGQNSNPTAIGQKKSKVGYFRLVSSMGLLLCLVLPAPAQAQFNFITNSGKITITKYTGLAGAVNIPSTINGLPVTNIRDRVLDGCKSLRGTYFQGNDPSLVSSLFSGATIATTYYRAGNKGWTSTFGCRPTAVWSLPMEISDTNFGIQTNGIGFSVTGTIVVDECTSLADPNWIPLLTNTPSGGLFYFADPRWTDYPGCFYRVRAK